MNEATNKEYTSTAALGLSPRADGRGADPASQSIVLISGRRTYADLFLKLSSDPMSTEPALFL